MAEHEHDDPETQPDEAASSNGHHIGKVAALAAAGGATAFAAKKALDSRTSGRSNRSTSSRRTRPRNSNGNGAGRTGGALLSAALEHGWNAAKDTLEPVVGDASSRVGNYVAEHAPDVVRDVVVPKFIAGFERARSGGRGENREPPEE